MTVGLSQLALLMGTFGLELIPRRNDPILRSFCYPGSPIIMNMQRIFAGGVIGGPAGLAIWYITQRALNIEFLGLNVLRYATFWLTIGIISGVAATFMRR